MIVDDDAGRATAIPAAVDIGSAVGVDPDGCTAVVCGTARNRHAEPRRVELTLEEHYGRTAAFGRGVSGAVPADGATHPWCVLVTTDGDPFQPNHPGCAAAGFENDDAAAVTTARVHFY
ncbi:hypothetical protein [Nocardia brasiliensis]|uniref:hypothetical protein n=1 Tax=Nocardia brasiliensis TaxID=37326 RepID=UPI002455C3A4|nr:hypothetical protein [Nocardia brasiliensis]